MIRTVLAPPNVLDCGRRALSFRASTFTALLRIDWVNVGVLGFREHTRDPFEPEISFVWLRIGGALKHTHLVVHTVEEPEGHLVPGLAEGADAISVARDHGGEFLLRLEVLALQGRTPVLKAPARAVLCVDFILITLDVA